MQEEDFYKRKKVITIGVVSQLTDLSERQIRYYESRGLIFPGRTDNGTRKYSFDDVETLIKIANVLEEGGTTFEIKQEMKKASNPQKERNKMIQGQLNARFGLR
ncbi:MerR family transcriptional regulator [Bacillus sp. V3B]|uniref:MerR family transcriptional regulator n=1 Tax=Bacillus sp. V3B TaxID=2804915 RepID=UPI002108793B|nr:MerR family transcriptional regulator [Bacillus sp. V3B]MCQ6276246.1 MerR family transcriptional regulator [Bacillus sp. V3B]